MRKVVVGIVFLLATLAGCMDEGATPRQEALQEAKQAATAVDVKATPTTGIIRGVVVDEAIRPIAGAELMLEPGAFQTTSNAAGGFGFEGLEAGAYHLTTSAPNHATTRMGVVVEVGNPAPDSIVVVLTYIQPSTPYAVAFDANLFIAVSFPLFGSLSPSDLGLAGDDRATFTIDPNATVIQMEVQWSASVPTAEQARMYGSASRDGSPLEIKSASGPSPLWVRVNGTSESDVADGFYMGVGSLSRALTSTEAPEPTGYLVVNQQYQAYAHAFYNMQPPEGWLFVRDGNPPMP